MWGQGAIERRFPQHSGQQAPLPARCSLLDGNSANFSRHRTLRPSGRSGSLVFLLGQVDGSKGLSWTLLYLLPWSQRVIEEGPWDRKLSASDY